MGELHLEVYTEVWKRMVRNAFHAFLVNKDSRLEAMVDRKHSFFFSFFHSSLDLLPTLDLVSLWLLTGMDSGVPD